MLNQTTSELRVTAFCALSGQLLEDAIRNVRVHFHPQSSHYIHLDTWTTSKHRRPLQLRPRLLRARPHNPNLSKSSSLTPPRVMVLLDATRGPRLRLQTSSTRRPSAIPRNPVPTRTPTQILNESLPSPARNRDGHMRLSSAVHVVPGEPGLSVARAKGF